MESASPGYCRDQIIAAVPCSMIHKCSVKRYITFYANISMVYVITLFILINLPVKDKNSSNRAVYRVQTLLSQARVTCGLSQADISKSIYNSMVVMSDRESSISCPPLTTPHPILGPLSLWACLHARPTDWDGSLLFQTCNSWTSTCLNKLCVSPEIVYLRYES